jgi:hypothetical protein
LPLKLWSIIYTGIWLWIQHREKVIKTTKCSVFTSWKDNLYKGSLRVSYCLHVQDRFQRIQF